MYTVTEDKVDNYTTKIDGTTITNTYKPGKTSPTVTKNWKDANIKMAFVQKQSRFNCMLVIKRLVRLLNCQQITNGPIPSQTLDEKKAGQVINYTVKEIDVPEGYTQAVEATNPGQVVVTNTHEPERPK